MEGRGLLLLLFASPILQAPALPGEVQRAPWQGAARGDAPRQPAGPGRGPRAPSESSTYRVPLPRRTGLNREGGTPHTKINSNLPQEKIASKTKLVLLCQLLDS